LKFLAALRFLTSIPLRWPRQASPEELGRSAVYFPVVGLVIGIMLAGLYWLLDFILPATVVSALLIVFLVAVTGALHLDGFADTCDGMAGHRTVEDRWRVMHDSRAGVFGIVGVVLLLLVKYASLSNIPDSLIMATLIFMPVVSRWAMVYTVFAYPYARPSGLGKALKQGIGWRGFTVATLITLSAAAAMIPLWHFTGLVIILGVWIMAAVMAAIFKRKFAGLTGDTYGAINEVAEVSVLILVILLARLGLA